LDNSHTSGVAQQNVRMIEAATRSIDRSSTMFMRCCQGIMLRFSIYIFCSSVPASSPSNDRYPKSRGHAVRWTGRGKTRLDNGQKGQSLGQRTSFAKNKTNKNLQILPAALAVCYGNAEMSILFATKQPYTWLRSGIALKQKRNIDARCARV
jgi:hypothetical protein